MNLRALLNDRFSQAFEKATGEALSPQIQLSGKPEFGDYQANGAMAAAKALKRKPRDIAEQVVAAAEVDDLAATLEVAGPGFINVHLKPEFLSQALADAPITTASPARATRNASRDPMLVSMIR